MPLGGIVFNLHFLLIFYHISPFKIYPKFHSPNVYVFEEKFALLFL